MVRTRQDKQIRRRVQWTDSMISDLLYCKREALIVTQGKHPPMKYGKKIGYIAYMHILWVSLGYGKLGKTPENLSSAAYNAQKKLNITSSMLMSTSSSSTSYANTSFAVQDGRVSKEEEAVEYRDMRAVDESKHKKCYYYKVSIYAALMAIFMMLSLVFILLYSRCYTTFGKLYQDHLMLNTKLCGSCHENAYCRVRKTKSTCICEDHYIGDGQTYCDDLSFAMEFNENTKEYPEITASFPKSSDISFCAWISMSIIPSKKMSIFLYSSDNSPDEYSFSVTREGVELNRNNQIVNISIPLLTQKYWNHFCCSWQSNGLVRFYINLLNTKERRLKTVPHASSTGTFRLGKIDDITMSYQGLISQFFMYNRTLSKNEILDMFRYRPTSNGLTVSWNDLRTNINSTYCDKPKDIRFPFMKN